MGRPSSVTSRWSSAVSEVRGAGHTVTGTPTGVSPSVRRPRRLPVRRPVPPSATPSKPASRRRTTVCGTSSVTGLDGLPRTSHLFGAVYTSPVGPSRSGRVRRRGPGPVEGCDSGRSVSRHSDNRDLSSTPVTCLFPSPAVTTGHLTATTAISGNGRAVGRGPSRGDSATSSVVVSRPGPGPDGRPDGAGPTGGRPCTPVPSVLTGATTGGDRVRASCGPTDSTSRGVGSGIRSRHHADLDTRGDDPGATNVSATDSVDSRSGLPTDVGCSTMDVLFPEHSSTGSTHYPQPQTSPTPRRVLCTTLREESYGLSQGYGIGV